MDTDMARLVMLAYTLLALTGGGVGVGYVLGLRRGRSPDTNRRNASAGPASTSSFDQGSDGEHGDGRYGS